MFIQAVFLYTKLNFVSNLKGNEAANVTGVGGVPVKGSQFALDRRPFGRRRGRGYFPRGGRENYRRQRFSRREYKEEASFENAAEGGAEKRESTTEAPERRRNRPYFKRFYRRPRGSGPPRGQRPLGHEEFAADEPEGENAAQGQVNQEGQRPRGQRRYMRQFFRRRPNRRPRSDTEGSQSGADGDASGVCVFKIFLA